MKEYQISWWLYRKWIYHFHSIYWPIKASVYRGWYRLFMEEEDLKIVPFEYNGFCGQLLPPRPPRMGKFICQTNDPGVVLVLVDGRELRVPTFAIINSYALPKLKWERGVMFGEGSRL